MGLGKILACSSLIALSIVSPKEISAITCMPWNLSVEINGDGKLIKEKTEELNQKIQTINRLQQQLRDLNIEALKLDGAISQLKELKEKDKKP